MQQNNSAQGEIGGKIRHSKFPISYPVIDQTLTYQWLTGVDFKPVTEEFTFASHFHVRYNHDYHCNVLKLNISPSFHVCGEHPEKIENHNFWVYPNVSNRILTAILQCCSVQSMVSMPRVQSLSEIELMETKAIMN